MTQKELLSLDHLKIAEVKPGYFLHVHTEDGWVLTDWNGEDIKEYSGSVCIYAPIKDEYNDYYIVTSEAHNSYMESQRKAIEEEMERERNQRENKPIVE